MIIDKIKKVNKIEEKPIKNDEASAICFILLLDDSLKCFPQFGHTLKFLCSSSLYIISLQLLHFTHFPIIFSDASSFFIGFSSILFTFFILSIIF